MHGPVSVDFSVPTAVEVTGLAAKHTRGIPGMAGRVGGALGSVDGRSADY